MSDMSGHCFDARTASCAQVREWLEAFCKKLKVSDHGTMQLTLVLEELFTNSMRHGYAPFKAQNALREWPVWIKLTHSGAGIHVDYEDAAFAFNPLENIQPPDYSGPPECWRTGGLGLPMISGIATDLRYERAKNRNRLRLTLSLTLPV